MPETRFRTTQRKIDGQWFPAEFEGLRQGDVFRLFEDSGDPVVWDGQTEFCVTKNPATIDPPGNFILYADKITARSTPLTKLSGAAEVKEPWQVVLINREPYRTDRPVLDYDDIALIVGVENPSIKYKFSKTGEGAHLPPGHGVAVTEGLIITAINTGGA